MYFTLYFLVTRLPDTLNSVRDHFLALDPTILTVDDFEKHLLAADKNILAVPALVASAQVSLSISAEGDCYLCVPPDPGIAPGIAPAALGACESAPLGTAPALALHTFTLDSGASRCFFRDSTTVTPLPAPVPVSLADPSGGPVLARSSTVLPCPTEQRSFMVVYVDDILIFSPSSDLVKEVMLKLQDKF
ncbi:unnamed protein product, partial [Closterium sp. NIES-53]